MKIIPLRKTESYLELIGEQISRSLSQQLTDFSVRKSGIPLEWRVYNYGVDCGGFCYDEDGFWMALYPLGEQSYISRQRLADRVVRAVWNAIAEVTSGRI